MSMSDHIKQQVLQEFFSKGLIRMENGKKLDSFVLPEWENYPGGGGWLDSLGSGIWVGRDILEFFKNIDLDNS